MLRNIRNFSKTIWAKIIMGFIIIAFATWGMGGMFSSGNSNNLAGRRAFTGRVSNRDHASISDFVNRNGGTFDDPLGRRSPVG